MDEESVLEIDKRGNKFWRNDIGQFHRLDGPAIERTNGDEFWYQDGKLHRLDGPASNYSSKYKKYKNWYVNGILHREDGPAVIGNFEGNEWYLRGVRYKSKETFFEHLSEEAKAKCLFSEDFLNG